MSDELAASEATPATAEVILFIRDKDGQSAMLRQVVREGDPFEATFDPVTVTGWHLEVHPATGTGVVA